MGYRVGHRGMGCKEPQKQTRPTLEETAGGGGEISGGRDDVVI